MAVPVGPSVSSTDLALGRWVGVTESMAFGIVMSSAGDRVFIRSSGSQLPTDSPWSPRLDEFQGPPSGEVSALQAVGAVTWPIDSLAGLALVAWEDGASSWVATSANGYSSSIVVLPGPLPVVDTDVLAVGVHSLEALPPTQSGVVEMGDVNGDGVLDLAVGETRSADLASRVLIHTGPFAMGLSNLEDDADYIFEMQAYEANPALVSTVGYSRAPIHDVDGDGSQDILIGSGDYLPERYTQDQLFQYVSVGPGGMVLWTGATAPGTYGPGTETAVIEGTCDSLLHGAHGSIGAVGPDSEQTLVAAVGLAVSAFGESERGALFLMDLEGVSGTVNVGEVSTAVILGDNAYDNIDDFAALGDLNSDGFDDFVVTSRWAGGQGAAYIFLGPVEGIRTASTADLTIYGSSEDGVFGASVEVWDGDGDGLSDLLIGAYLSDYGALTDSGAVHFFSGASLLAAMAP